MPTNPDLPESGNSINAERRGFMLRFSKVFRIRENCFSEYMEVPLGRKLSLGSKYYIARQEFFEEGNDEYFQVFESPKKLLAILYDPYEVDRLQVLARSTDKIIVAYIFPMSAKIAYVEFLALAENIRVETIPGWILEAYKKAFRPFVPSSQDREELAE